MSDLHPSLREGRDLRRSHTHTYVKHGEELIVRVNPRGVIEVTEEAWDGMMTRLGYERIITTEGGL